MKLSSTITIAYNKQLKFGSGLSVAVQCGIAIVLFFTARGLANLWHRIQVARYVRIEEAEQIAPYGPEKPTDGKSSSQDDEL